MAIPDGQTCLLFTYGLLQPHYHPPRTMSEAIPDRIRGTLFDLGDYPALVDPGAGGWISGYTLTISPEELSELDRFEDTASGEFRRIQHRTESGCVAWIYEYTLPVPDTARRISIWRSPDD